MSVLKFTQKRNPRYGLEGLKHDKKLVAKSKNFPEIPWICIRSSENLQSLRNET